MDGTFKCVKSLCTFCTIHSQYGGFIVQLVYAFLLNKQAYLAALGLRPCVTEIVTDCEAAVVSVVREMLSAVTHRTIATSRKTAH